MSKRCHCTIFLSFIFFPVSLHSMHIVFPCLHVYVSVFPCPSGFLCFFFCLFFSSVFPSLSASFSLVLRTRRWHGAWPDEVIPQCRGLPGRDSLDTVSPLLARCRLQREGRPEPEWGGKKEQWGRGKAGRKRPRKKSFRNQRMEPMFKYTQSSSIDHLLNETQRRRYFLIDFVLSLSLSNSVKS